MYTPFSYMYTPLGICWGPVWLGAPGGPPEAWLVLGLSLGVRVSPGYIFREVGVHIENMGVHASLAFSYYARVDLWGF